MTLLEDGTARLTGRRLRHALEALRAPFTFGPRTLRVGVAVPYALGALRAQ